MKQIPLPIAALPRPTFDNFVAGANQAALAHLRELQLPAAPVYLWGPAGSGKSHLLRALATKWQDAGQRVGWFDATCTPPWEVAPDWSLLLLDRCESLQPEQQHAAFTAFVEAGAQGMLLVAAGRLPPVDLPLRDDLRTRLGWGPVWALQPLGEDQTRAVLRREADQRGIFLSDELMDYLLTRFPRDLVHLSLVLDRLDHFGLARGRRITLPLLRSMLAEEGLAEAGGA